MRKRIVSCLFLFLALTLLFGGCTESQSDIADEEADEEAVETASIVLSTETTEDLFYLPYTPSLGVNPFSCESQVNTTFLPLVYEGLFTVTPSFEPEGVLCSSWEVSDDGTVYAFTLQENVTFQSGAVLTAEDVVYSIEYAMTSDLYARRLSCILSVEAQSGLVIVTLDQARGQFPVLLDIPIVRAGTADQDQPDGTGPYTLVLEDDGDNYLDARSDWWQDTAQPISRIYLLTCETAADVRDSFEYGRISLACTDVNGSQAIVYHSDCEQWSMPTAVMAYLGFNTDSGVFSLSGARQAVTFAVDRDAIVVSCYGGYATAASLPAPPASEAYDAQLASDYDYDSVKAAQLLSDAGLSDTDRDGILDYETESGIVSADVVLIVCRTGSSAVAAANAIADDLNALGLTVTVEALSEDDYAQKKAQGDYDLYYEEVRLTADFDLTYFLSELGGVDTYTDTLCDLALENVGNNYDLHTYLMSEGVFCPIAFKSYAVFTARGCVSGLNPVPGNVFYGLSNIVMMSKSG